MKTIAAHNAALTGRVDIVKTNLETFTAMLDESDLANSYETVRPKSSGEPRTLVVVNRCGTGEKSDPFFVVFSFDRLGKLWNIHTQEVKP